MAAGIAAENSGVVRRYTSEGAGALSVSMDASGGSEDPKSSSFETAAKNFENQPRRSCCKNRKTKQKATGKFEDDRSERRRNRKMHAERAALFVKDAQIP